MTVGDGLREIRKKRNFTQEDLGDSINMEKVQLCQLENPGSNPTHKTLVRIVHKLNIKMSEFYAIIGD